jgi:ubiquinone/menaquinone biosynthesis C-methylase UbiE
MDGYQMADRSKQTDFFDSIQNNYDRLSGVYDLLSSGSERRIMQRAIHMLQPGEGANILDIGCGTGTALLQMSELTHACGVDLSFRMCQKAAGKLRHAANMNHIHIACANALYLPFSNASYDRILMSFTMEIFPRRDIPDLLAECSRILAPAGKLCVVNISETDCRHLVYGLYRWSHDRFPAVVDCRPINAGEFLRQAGFQVERSEAFSLWGIPVSIILAKSNRKELS